MDCCKTCKYHDERLGWTKGWGNCELITDSTYRDNGMIKIGADDDYGLGCETHPDFVCKLYERKK